MDRAIWSAFGAASTAAMAAVMPADPAERELAAAFDGSCWPFMGEIPVAITTARAEGGFRAYEAAFMERIAPLVEFARTWPDAPLEALYRHARSCGVHDRPSDGFDDVEPAFRIAYAVFRATLIEADRVFAEEEARAARKAAADRPQAPVLVRAEDTILEQHGTIFEKVDDPAPMVNLGGPVVKEGEGGDAAEHLEQLAGGAADQGHVDLAAGAADGSDPASAGPGVSGDDQRVGDADFAAHQAEAEAGAAPAADDAGSAQGVAGGAAQPISADGVDGPAAADPASEAPSADALEAEAKAVSPARRKR